MKKIFTSFTGSRLYGTQTPMSDTDIKYILLANIDDLLLGKKPIKKQKKTSAEPGVRNGRHDIDEEFIPVQLFAEDFLNGQTYALEMVFAAGQDHAGQDAHGSEFLQFARELREKFLTADVKSMVGYAANQARIYSKKGDRLNVVRKVRELFETTMQYSPLNRIGEYMQSNAKFASEMQDLCLKNPNHLKISSYDIGAGNMKPCFVLLEKTMPFSDRLSHATGVVKTLEQSFGSRADAASASGIDWRALMHAIRIADETLSLLEFGFIRLPFSAAQAKRLLSIKHGECSIAEIQSELDEKLKRIKELERTTNLQSLTPELTAEMELWLTQWLRRFYGITEVAR